MKAEQLFLFKSKRTKNKAFTEKKQNTELLKKRINQLLLFCQSRGTIQNSPEIYYRRFPFEKYGKKYNGYFTLKINNSIRLFISMYCIYRFLLDVRKKIKE